MNESYAEAGCRRKATASTYAMKVGMILLCVLLFFLSAVSQIMLFIAALAIVGVVFLFPRLNVEYEYIFCDGQLDFDQISGGQKRKTKLRIDFNEVELCAPVKAHELDAYTYKDLKVINFTSHTDAPNTYAIIIRDKDITKKILFEPSEKMIDCMRQKAPSKVVKTW